jgi:hypothetical protein
MKLNSVVPTCGICGKQVPLEICKIDEQGQALHEACAVARLASHNDTASTLKPISQDLAAPQTRELDSAL